MATTTAASLVPVAATVGRTQKRTTVVQVRAMAGFQGLTVNKPAVALAKRRTSRGRGGFNVQCNAAAEIFKIAAIMNGLTLIGVAVGFLLLRIEAYVEESEE